MTLMRAPILQLTPKGKLKLHLMLSVPMALVAAAVGVFLFFQLGSWERENNAKMQRIQAGDVKPVLLTAVGKRSPGDRSDSRYYVTLRGSNQPPFEISIAKDCYDLIQTGDISVAYHFPDGYFIPRFHLGGLRVGQWLFLGGGLIVAAIFLAEPFVYARRLGHAS
jgi:hypothetical protein